jgi:hypothetical protein
MLEDTLRKTNLTASGADLDAALTELGWPEMVTTSRYWPYLCFPALGETGSHASILVDVWTQRTVTPSRTA